MELPSWLGIPTLAFGLGSRTPQQGLVLAGGGSRTSFQMGALRHLYDVVGIAPTAVVATSAGSIVACALSQWTDPAKQSAALRQLETMWLGMTDKSDMFTPRTWFSRLLEKGPEWMSLLNREAARAKSQRPWMSLPFHRGPEQTKVPDPAEPIAGRDDDRLTGQASTLEMSTRDDPVACDSWTPGVVLQLLSALSRLSLDGGDISAIATITPSAPQPLMSLAGCSPPVPFPGYSVLFTSTESTTSTVDCGKMCRPRWLSGISASQTPTSSRVRHEEPHESPISAPATCSI